MKSKTVVSYTLGQNQMLNYKFKIRFEKGKACVKVRKQSGFELEAKCKTMKALKEKKM